MDRLSAACTAGCAADKPSAGSAEFMAAATTAPAGSINPRSTAGRYFGSTRRKVASPTPIDTYAIIADRIDHGNSCATNSDSPLTTTNRNITGVQTTNPIRAPICLYAG